MIQFIFHLFGDYVSQSDYCANNKTKAHLPALVHATIYALPFLLIASVNAWLVIWITHFFIDRYRLARYVVFAKEFLAPRSHWPKNWEDHSATGYHKDKPLWLSVWLMIACDNTLHLLINYLAIFHL